MRQARQYLKYLLGAATGVALLAIGLAYIVDPYGVFRPGGIAGISQPKPMIYRHTIDAKIALLRRSNPKTLLVGTSRVEIGFDPDSMAWPKASKPVFNLGIPGGAFDARVRALKAAFKIRNRIEYILFAVGFFDSMPFLVGSANSRLITQSLPAYQIGRPVDWLFGLAPLGDSARTLWARGNSEATQINSSGMRLKALTWRKVDQLGPMPYYLHHAVTTLRAFQNLTSRRDPVKFIVMDGLNRRLRDLLSFTASKGVKLDFMLLPHHAYMWDVLECMGYATDAWEWKKATLKTINGSANSLGIEPPVIYDFTGYNAYTAEAFSGDAERGERLKWFFEGGYFTPPLGDEFAHAIFDGKIENLGWIISESSLAARQSADNAAKAALMKSDPNWSLMRHRIIAGADGPIACQ